MNKPTREQVEHRAIEILSDTYPLIAETMIEKAEKELTTILSDNNSRKLKILLDNLEVAIGHKYTHIEIKRNPVRHTRFYIKGDRGLFDTVAKKYFCLFELEYDKKYSIEELLND